MNHRANAVLVNDSGNADLGQSYLVNVYSVGGIAVSAGSGATTATLRAGHGFKVGDVFMVGIDTTLAKSITAVTATTIAWSGAISFAAGALFVNLGADSLTGGTPDYDGSRMAIYSDMDGSTAIASAQLTADATTGNYDYYHEGAGHHWELVRDSSGAPLEVIDGVGSGPLTPGDYGANGDATDEVGQLQALLWAGSGLAKRVTFPIGKTYLISTGIDMRTRNNLTIKGHGSTIKFQNGVADTLNASNVHTQSILWFKTSSQIRIDGLGMNGNLSNRTVYSPQETFNDCLTLDDGCADVTIENCYITEAMTDGVLLDINTSGTPCERIKILNNRITKCRRNNISVVGGIDVDIIGNLIEDGGLSNVKGMLPRANINLAADSVGGTGALDRVNVLRNTLLRGTGVYSMTVSHQMIATDVVIEGNSISGHIGAAGAATPAVPSSGLNWNYKSGGVGATTGNTGCRITNNIIHNNAAGGLRVTSDTVERIDGNVIHTNATHGIQPQNCEMMLIENNRIHSNGTSGTGTGAGITTGAVYGELIVRNNTFYNNDGPALTAVMDTDGATLLFKDNFIYDDQGTATQTLCSRSGSGTVRVNAIGNVYRNLLTSTYTNFNMVSDDVNIGGAAETELHPLFRDGISVGRTTDANVSCLTVHRSATTKVIQWDDTNVAWNFGEQIRAAGEIFLSGSFGQTMSLVKLESEVTLSTVGITTDTAGLLPAGSIILGVVALVTTTIATASNWSLGDTVQANRFTLSKASLTAGTTNVGLLHRDPTVASSDLGPVQATSGTFRITTTGTPTAGKIRITVFAMVFVPPTS